MLLYNRNDILEIGLTFIFSISYTYHSAIIFHSAFIALEIASALFKVNGNSKESYNTYRYILKINRVRTSPSNPIVLLIALIAIYKMLSLSILLQSLLYSILYIYLRG